MKSGFTMASLRRSIDEGYCRVAMKNGWQMDGEGVNEFRKRAHSEVVESKSMKRERINRK